MDNKIQNTFSKFLKFEEEYNMFDKEINGFYFWGQVRFYIFKKIMESLSINKTNYFENVKTKDKIFNENIFTSILKSPLFIKKKKFLIINTHHRILENGKYKCKYTDYLSDILENKTQCLELRSAYKHKTPTYCNNTKYTDFLDLFSDLYFKILNKTFNFSKLDLQEINDIATSLHKEFNIDNDFSIKILKNSYLFYKSNKGIINYILRKTKPKYLFITSSYTKHNNLLTYLAQKQNITVIELQHGIISPYHIGYNTLHKKQTLGIPDKIILFGNYWRKNINIPIENKNIHISGFDNLITNLNKFSTSNTDINTKEILIISQWTITDKIIKFSNELLNLINKKKYRLRIRFHPAEYKNWQKNYPELIDSNIIINNNNEQGLYQNIVNSEFVIGCYSTALYEAVAFNKKIFVLAINGLELHVEDLYMNNYAIKIKNAKEFIEAIKTNKISTSIDVKNMWFPEIKIKDAL